MKPEVSALFSANTKWCAIIVIIPAIRPRRWPNIKKNPSGNVSCLLGCVLTKPVTHRVKSAACEVQTNPNDFLPSQVVDVLGGFGGGSPDLDYQILVDRGRVRGRNIMRVEVVLHQIAVCQDAFLVDP